MLTNGTTRALEVNRQDLTCLCFDCVSTVQSMLFRNKHLSEIQQFTILALGQYERIMNLRMLNPNLKILLAIGGWTHGTAPFTAVVVDPNNIAAFAANTLEYLKTYKFDGLDLDWEYPGGNGSPPEDKQRFTSLVQVGT